MTWNDPNPFNPTDPNDLRLNSLIKGVGPIKDSNENLDFSYILNSELESIPALLSYPDDSGILINKGRPGAKLSPDTIRKYLYRMTPWKMKNTQDTVLFDWGSIPTLDSSKFKAQPNNSNEGSNLQFQVQENHRRAITCATQILKKHPLITLGGGHDYGFCDGVAFLETQSSSNQIKPLIINLDAHMDVRPDSWGDSSGTPFYRLLNKYPDKFEFIEWGIQPQCNQIQHIQWAQSQGASIATIEDIRSMGSLGLIKSLLQNLSPNQKCFISLDIDVFSQSLAPGCSQSWDGGLTYSEVHELLNWLYKNKNVRLFSIYEVSQPLDQDDRTSKLAAQLIYNYLKK